MDVLIKNVPEESWKSFKIEAIKRNKNLGDLFGEIVEEIGSSEGNWEKIKKHKKFLSDEDAEEIKKSAKEFRKNFKFRY